jgi:hypothetical protein
MTADLDTILARASDPFERIAADWVEPAGPRPDRYEQWLRLAAKGDAERGLQILSARGLTEQQWRSALSDVRLTGTGRPQWAHAVADLVDHMDLPSVHNAPALGEVVGAGLPAWVDPDQPWRFYPGFAGWMQRGRTLMAGWTDQVAPAALERFLVHLVRRWLPIVGPTLMQTPEIFDGGARRGWLGLWDSYPVMARLMGVAWLQWQTATQEVLTRIGELDGHVVDVGLADGDLHNGGRSVTRVQFADESVWFLKPRPEGVHPVVTSVLHQVDPTLTLPHTRLHPTYVWAQAVPAQDCPDLSTFWWRAGASLRVFQALGGTDLHNENFVPSADMPVLVDLETVIGASPDQQADVPSATSMVSSYTDGPPGTASVDIGAMAGPSLGLTPYAVPQLALGADGPVLRHVRTQMSNGQSLPRVDAVPVSVVDHVRDVVDGYLFADAALPRVTLPEAPADAVVRLVPRATQIYSRLLEQSLKPQNLTDGVDRELVLERLWLALGNTTADVIDAEQLALRELDVPLFHIRVGDGHAFSDRGARAAGLDTAPPLSAWASRTLPQPHRSDDVRAALFCAAPDADWDGPQELRDPVELLLGAADRGWIGLDYDPGRYRWVQQRMGPGLIGVAGIGLALAAHAALSNDPHPDAADTAVSALLECAQRMARRGPFVAADAFTGPSGVVYALGLAHRLLAEVRLLEAAMGLLPQLNAGPPSRVMSNLAGARLALLNLPDRPQVQFARTRLNMLSDDAGGDVRTNRFTAALPGYDAGFFLLGADSKPGDSPGDLIARAARMDPPQTLPEDPLTAAVVAQAAWQSTGEQRWKAQMQARREDIRARARVHGTWFPGNLAPDSQYLNAIHGVAAVVMLDLADSTDAPNVRVFR